MRPLARLVLALALPVLLAPSLPAADGLALTPPMGWNSWNKFGCNVSEKLIKGAADALVASGMQDAGYQYVVIDDCWQVSRDATGNIMADPERFPSGIKAVADYVHSKGLKFGIYSDAGTMTCAEAPRDRRTTRPRTRGPTPSGASTTSSTTGATRDGQDTRDSYARMSRALRATGRPIVFSDLRVGRDEALAVGPGHRAPVARHRRHPGLLGLRQELGRHGRHPHHRHHGRPPRVRRPRPLERPRHAGGGQRRPEPRREPRPLQLLGALRRAAHGRQRPRGHDPRGPRHPHQPRGDRGGPGPPRDAGPQGLGRRPARGVGEAARRRLEGGHPLQPRHRGDDARRRWEDIGLFPGGKAVVRDLWRKEDAGAFTGRYEAGSRPTAS